MIEGINIDQRIPYTLKRDTDPKTTFVFRPISGTDMLNIQSRARGLSEGDCIVELLCTSIEEIEGYEDKRKLIKSLSIDDLNELLNKHNDINLSKDDEQKN